MRAGRTLGVALAAVLVAVASLVVLAGGGGSVASAECSPTTILPCGSDTTSAAPTTHTSTTAPTTEAPTTVEKAATTQAVETTERPATTARPTATSAARDETVTTDAPTSNPLIVPGPDPAAAGADAAAKAAKKNGDKTGTVVALVIASLLVLAIVIGLLTYRFWRNTRPLVAHPEVADRPPTRNGAGPARRPRVNGNGTERTDPADAPLLRR